MKLVAVQLVLSMATKPQVPEEDDDVVEQYLNTDTCVVKEEEIISADGFNAAFCMGTYCLGFASEPFWNNPQVTITVICNGIEEEYCWYCVSSPLHYKDSSFIEWRQQFLPVVLTQTDISPFDKQVNLPSHHGKNKLIEHAKHLLDSPYVEGILTSLVFKRGANSYVMKNSDFAHGLIDIVLYWEEDGYSMRVKTTGKNTRETLLIADLLTKKYGRGK
ncbi:MAG: hypothetical protein J5374_10630 [Bacteroidales bacterium]|nr:hypothetical protein [Bacteroidales bacterium]